MENKKLQEELKSTTATVVNSREGKIIQTFDIVHTLYHDLVYIVSYDEAKAAYSYVVRACTRTILYYIYSTQTRQRTHVPEKDKKGAISLREDVPKMYVHKSGKNKVRKCDSVRI